MESRLSVRPTIFEYESVPRFVNDMLEWRRTSEPEFSIRASLEHVTNCSPTLVSQVAKGARSLTRDRVEVFGSILRLNQQEIKYLDQWIAATRQNHQSTQAAATPKKKLSLSSASKRPSRRPQNSIISNWLNVYVKEACKLKHFSPDPRVIQKLLGGIASVEQIQKSLDFLIREGFLRRTLDNSVVQNNSFSVTSDQIPNHKIRAFHRRALDLVKQNFETQPIEKRQDHTYILAVNEKNLPKIRKILLECVEGVEQFEQDHPNEDEQLFQISIHLTPASGKFNELH